VAGIRRLAMIMFYKVPRNLPGKIEKPRLREKYCSEESLVKA